MLSFFQLYFLLVAFEILSSPKLKLNQKIKINLIKKLSECSGHLGIAGGQYLDLSYERKKISRNKILEMEIKKTGMLFSFCCAAPAIIKKKTIQEITKNLNPRYTNFIYISKSGDTYESIINNIDIEKDEKKLVIKTILAEKKLNILRINQKFKFKTRCCGGRASFICW